MTKISVIIPTFNSERYIIKTLDSVSDQTVLPYEIIVVDDGSTDDTIQVVENYMRQNHIMGDRINIYQQKNMGAGAARNRGVRESKGDWIAFLDSDDIWLPDKIEDTIKMIEAFPEYGMVTHDEYFVEENNIERKVYCNLHKNYDQRKNLFLQLFEGNLFSTSCMTVKREAFLKAGGFDASLLSAQDYDMWIRLGKEEKVIFIEKPLEIYTVRKGNITSNTYRRYRCEMRICEKYKNNVYELLGMKSGKRVILKRVFRIHKTEVYLALKQGQICVALKIMFQFPGHYWRAILGERLNETG